MERVAVIFPDSPRLNARQATEMKDAAVDGLNRGTVLFVVKLDKVKTADSRALGFLMSLTQMIRREGRVAFCGLNEELKSLFRITGLSEKVPWFSDEQTAREYLLCARENCG
jgi:anti-anti-sigma factor